MTAASRTRLENGTSSVMHSSINIANEYVSECVVAGTSLVSMSSGAEYLTTSPDDTVFEVAFLLISSEILAIPKSQTCGSPFRYVISAYSASRMRTWNLLRGRQVRFSMRIQPRGIHRGLQELTHLTAQMSNRAYSSNVCQTYHSRVQHPVSGDNSGRPRNRATKP